MRTAFFACLLALLVAAPAALADDTRTKILRDCQDSKLDGNYTPAQIRDARKNIPDDIDQYSDCRDVLTRALLNATGNSGDGGDGGGGGVDSGGGGGGGGGGGQPLTPSTDADRQALDSASKTGGQAVDVAGRRVAPGEGLRNDLPTTLLVVLVLLAVAAVAAIVPFLRRNAFDRLTALGPTLRRVLPGRSG